MDEDARAAAGAILRRLEQAWNEANGAAFAAPFAAEADFVDIRGEQHRGRATIAGGHQALFDTIYRGSHVQYQLVQARQLTQDVILAHAGARLSVPDGPLAGDNSSVLSLVLMQAGGDWLIEGFHNTLVPKM